ncbi:MAG: hypothetical protein WD688_18055 [Candidatus Binatia bacterium]
MKIPVEPLQTMCKELEEDLVLYYYGEVDVDKRRIERHLDECKGCRRFLDDLHRLLPQIAAPEELPQSFWDNYYRETVAKLAQQQEQKDWWRNLLTPMRMWMIPAFGTAAIAALAYSMILAKGNLEGLYNQPQERIPQEIVTDTEQLEFFKTMDMLESLSALEGLDARKNEAQSEGHPFNGKANSRVDFTLKV